MDMRKEVFEVTQNGITEGLCLSDQFTADHITSSGNSAKVVDGGKSIAERLAIAFTSSKNVNNQTEVVVRNDRRLNGTLLALLILGGLLRLLGLLIFVLSALRGFLASDLSGLDGGQRSVGHRRIHARIADLGRLFDRSFDWRVLGLLALLFLTLLLAAKENSQRLSDAAEET
jgi:hypothetical protein